MAGEGAGRGWTGLSRSTCRDIMWPTDSGNQSCPEASIPDLAVRIIRLFEELSLGSSESNLTLVFSF